MPMRVFAMVLLLPALAGWGDETPSWPVSGPMPDAPVRVPGDSYVGVGVGTKAFVPVEPLPWGDVNIRVAPKPAAKPDNPGHEGH